MPKKSEIQELKDLVENALIAVRDSASPSLSQVILDLTRKLDGHIETHERDTKEIYRKLDKFEPMYEAYSSASKVRGAIMWIGGTLVSLVAGVEAWRKLTGK